MKSVGLLILFVLSATIAYCQDVTGLDSIPANPTNAVFTSVEQSPEFPGGVNSFFKYLQRNLNYNEITKIIGINRKMNIAFTVGKDGSLTNVHALDTICADCEKEAIAIISRSPRWMPGKQNGVPVKINYNVAVAFSAPTDMIDLKELRKSDYGFMFEIKGAIYSVEQAEGFLGKSFPSANVEIVLPADNTKYPVHGKSDTYIIKIKQQ